MTNGNVELCTTVPLPSAIADLAAVKINCLRFAGIESDGELKVMSNDALANPVVELAKLVFNCGIANFSFVASETTWLMKSFMTEPAAL